MRNNELKRITITVNERDYSEIEKLAKEMSCSCSFLIRQSMKNLIKSKAIILENKNGQ
jgi:hypothetical protein